MPAHTHPPLQLKAWPSQSTRSYSSQRGLGDPKTSRPKLRGRQASLGPTMLSLVGAPSQPKC